MNVSSYINYLPSVLWSRNNDPTQFLGRMLCIFEKILTEIHIDTWVTRAKANIVNAENNRIEVISLAEAENFRVGDIITIEGTAERVSIHHIDGKEIFLTANLGAAYPGGVIRIANLIPGQITFRLENNTGLRSGKLIIITQDQITEAHTVSDFSDEFITLTSGLTNTFPMADTDVPVSNYSFEFPGRTSPLNLSSRLKTFKIYTI